MSRVSGRGGGVSHSKARILLPKVSEADRRTLSTHLQLFKNAQQLNSANCKTLTDSEVLENWRPLKLANKMPTTSAKEGLCARYVKNLADKISDAPAIDDIVDDMLKEMSQATVLWTDVKSFEQNSLKTDEVLMASTAISQAIVAAPNGFWAERLRDTAKLADKLQQDGPQMKAAFEKISKLGQIPSETTAQTLKDIAKNMNDWEVTVHSSIAEELRAALLEMTMSSSKALFDGCAKGGQKVDLDEEKKAVCFYASKDLFKELAGVFLGDEKLHHQAERLNTILEDLDMGAKHAMLEDAISEWAADSLEYTHKLRDAFDGCRGKVLPGNLAKLVYDKWATIMASAATEEAFLPSSFAGRFDALELLSAHGPDDRKAGMQKLSTWVKASWRMNCSLNDLQAASNNPEDPAPSAAAYEKKVRELKRAVQQVEQVDASHLVSEGFLPLAKIISDMKNTAANKVKNCATEILQQLRDSLRADTNALVGSFESDPGVMVWRKDSDGLDNLDTAIELFKKSMRTSPVQDWVSKCDAISGKVTMLTNKSHDFSVDPTNEEKTTAKDQLSQIRAYCSEHDVLTSFSDPALLKNKLGLRRAMLAIQTKIKTWEVYPESLNPILLSQYRVGLKMR